MDDLIRRQDALDALKRDEEYDEDIPNRADGVRDAIITISNLPTVSNLPKKGKWIRITQGAVPEQYICPFCHRIIETCEVEDLLSIRYPYCHCGANMRGENDG